jgi:hypothetical protein
MEFKGSKLPFSNIRRNFQFPYQGKNTESTPRMATPHINGTGYSSLFLAKLQVIETTTIQGASTSTSSRGYAYRTEYTSRHVGRKEGTVKRSREAIETTTIQGASTSTSSRGHAYRTEYTSRHVGRKERTVKRSRETSRLTQKLLLYNRLNIDAPGQRVQECDPSHSLVERKTHTDVSYRCRIPAMDNASAIIPPRPMVSQPLAANFWRRGPSSTHSQQGKSILPSHPSILANSGSSRMTFTTNWNFQDTESQPGLTIGSTIHRDFLSKVQSLKKSAAMTKSIFNVSNKNIFLDFEEPIRAGDRLKQPFDVNHLQTFVKKLFWHMSIPRKQVTRRNLAHRGSRSRAPKLRRGELYAIRDTAACPSNTKRVDDAGLRVHTHTQRTSSIAHPTALLVWAILPGQQWRCRLAVNLRFINADVQSNHHYSSHAASQSRIIEGEQFRLAPGQLNAPESQHFIVQPHTTRELDTASKMFDRRIPQHQRGSHCALRIKSGELRGHTAVGHWVKS